MSTDEQQQDTPAGDAPQDPLEAMAAERDQFKALAQRAQADFINYKRRTDEERPNIARTAVGGLLARMLPAVDDLDRAVDALPADAPASWAEGVRLVRQNLDALLEAEGVRRFTPAPGETFDPAQHEAISQLPSAEQPAGTVLTAVRSGYRYGERVLRAAQVVVSREPG
jgi:molecular chaperone GrpE